MAANGAENAAAISVVIPTFNRRRSLAELLASLAAQTLPAVQFEVIVVDDGSTDGSEDLAEQAHPFRLRWRRQPNAGDAAARNTGAGLSAAEWLVFLDDDMLVHPGFLAALLPDMADDRPRIVVGADVLWLEERNPIAAGIVPPAIETGTPDPTPIPFAEVCSNNMAIRRRDFFAVGPMIGLDYPGSSIWCDVEFAYRAFLLGFEFVRRPGALCWHRDYVARDHASTAARMHEAAFRAARLFRLHPALIGYLPMFSDMTPLELPKDLGKPAIRKLIRRISAARPVTAALERLAAAAGAGPFRTALHRWIVGARIYLGYRRGLRELPPQ